MKFAENNRISQRQLYRQTVLTLLAPFLLCLPGEGGLLGKEGIAGILAACGILAVYVLLLLRMVPWYTDPVKNLGPFQGRAAGIFFVSYVILTGAYLLRLMEDLIPEMLAPGVSGTESRFFPLRYAVLELIKECSGEEGWRRCPAGYFWEEFF